jgi:hypothetical protein
MRLRRCAAALSTAGLVAVLGGASGVVAQAAGGASAGPDLSTPEAAKAYLVSQGFDPSKFIFQVGLKNYSGPSCPGLGWNCTTANLVVQIASAGGENYAECAEDARRCVIVQGSNAQLVGPLVTEDKDVNMHARCNPGPNDKGEHMRLHESGTQPCMITQINKTTGNNHAVASMLIQDKDGPQPQFGQQDAEVTQETHGDGDNHAVVHEEIVLDTHDESTQQDGFQSLVLNQRVLPLLEGTNVVEPATGDNFADVKETQKITAHARSDGSMQFQQTSESERVLPGDPCTARPAFDANSCVEFHQTTGTGRNTLIAHMDHNVAAIAAGTGASQTQGCMTKECGLELDGTQGGPDATNTVDDNQTIHYTLNGPDGTTQIQDPPIRNGPGFQAGGLWEVDQLAVLRASDPFAMQGHVNVVNDTSTGGTVDAHSVIIIDGVRSEIVCNASTCNYAQVCGDVGEFDPGEGVQEVACPDFMVFPPILT